MPFRVRKHWTGGFGLRPWSRRIDWQRKSAFYEILADRLILKTFDFRTNFFLFRNELI